MSDCMGKIAVSTKTDQEMADFLRKRAEELGVTRAELLRRLLDYYKEASEGPIYCPYCENELQLDL